MFGRAHKSGGAGAAGTCFNLERGLVVSTCDKGDTQRPRFMTPNGCKIK